MRHFLVVLFIFYFMRSALVKIPEFAPFTPEVVDP
jgi:hypothetical protein